MPGRRYAIVVDEALSSQSGSSADAVKKLLGQGEDDEQDVLTASASARGKHPNLSYFAFTATPKDKTLNLFGQRSPVTRKMKPFHTYSMRQAISEGFILDVLRKYSTYDTYFRLRNAAVDEPERTVDARKARAALVRAVKLNPAAVDQQAQIIVDHYREHIMPRLSGRAKAMVVTASRKQAVVLYQAIRSYVDKREFADCGALVAFSDTLSIDGIDYTEAKLNGFPPSQLPARFGYVKADDPHAATRDQAEYRILVVADKYQTGFDEPLLTVMYVDKKLDGVAAVQTLSRLNRVHPLKTQDDVWVLDFANDAESIQKAGLANDDIDNFGQVFDRHLRRVVGERAKANDTLVRRFFGEDPEFKEVFTHVARKQAYDLIRRPARREAEERLRRRGNEPTEG
jgi:type I restriction enzyme R subunit